MKIFEAAKKPQPIMYKRTSSESKVGSEMMHSKY